MFKTSIRIIIGICEALASAFIWDEWYYMVPWYTISSTVLDNILFLLFTALIVCFALMITDGIFITVEEHKKLENK